MHIEVQAKQVLGKYSHNKYNSSALTTRTLHLLYVVFYCPVTNL